MIARLSQSYSGAGDLLVKRAPKGLQSTAGVPRIGASMGGNAGPPRRFLRRTERPILPRATNWKRSAGSISYHRLIAFAQVGSVARADHSTPVPPNP